MSRHHVTGISGEKGKAILCCSCGYEVVEYEWQDAGELMDEHLRESRTGEGET